MKKIKPASGNPVYTYYVHDGQGSILSVYSKYSVGLSMNYTLTERDIFGSARIGAEKTPVQLCGVTPGFALKVDTFKRYLGNKEYELENHLGNILAMVSDRKIPRPNSANDSINHYEADLLASNDYYPFGWYMPQRQFNPTNYRYGMNGQEKDDEINNIPGTNYSAEFWQYDSRLGRRWNTDPIIKPWESPYESFSDNPIVYIDPFGDFETKFGAYVYKIFHGGKVVKAQFGPHAGEYYVDKKVYGDKGAKGSGHTLPEAVVHDKVTYDWGGSSVAEYGRGAVGALGNFLKFAIGGGGNKTYKEGSFEADEMATSPGVRHALNRLKDKLAEGTYDPVHGVEFSYSF